MIRVYYVRISFEPDVGSHQSVSEEFNHQDRISGDHWDGVYQSSLTVPQYSAGGRGHLRSVSLRDIIGNYQGLLSASTSTLIMNQFWNNYPQHLYVPVVGR